MATPVLPQTLSETSLSANFQLGVEQKLRSRLERAERLLSQAISDMRYWGNQIAIAHQSLACFEPQNTAVPFTHPVICGDASRRKQLNTK